MSEKKEFNLSDFNNELLKLVNNNINKEKTDEKVDIVKEAFSLIKKCLRIDGISTEEKKESIDIAIEIIGKAKWDLLLLLYSFYYDYAKNQQNKSIIADTIRMQNDISKIYNYDNIIMLINDMNDVAINDFLKEMVDFKEKDYNDRSKRDKFICAYLLFVIAIDNKYDNDSKVLSEKMKIFQNIYFTCFAEDNVSDKYNIEAISNSIINNRYGKLFGNYIYLAKDISAKLKIIENEKANLLFSNNDLIAKNNECNETINKLEVDVKERDEKISELTNDIKELNEKISSVIKNEEYNKNFYEQQFVASRAAILSQIKSDIKLEIEGIQDLIEDIPENLKNKVVNRISRINEKLS